MLQFTSRFLPGKSPYLLLITLLILAYPTTSLGQISRKGYGAIRYSERSSTGSYIDRKSQANPYVARGSLRYSDSSFAQDATKSRYRYGDLINPGDADLAIYDSKGYQNFCWDSYKLVRIPCTAGAERGT